MIDLFNVYSLGVVIILAVIAFILIYRFTESLIKTILYFILLIIFFGSLFYFRYCA